LQLSKAEVQRYRHLDYTHLEKILQKAAGNYKNVFIVSESIFSMDGDMAHLPTLVELKKKYSAYLYVDEAHAVGVRGENGLGCVEEFGCINDCDFIVGTFGKAIASVGAYVVCDDIFKKYLVNRSRTLIFTTALPPLNLAWTNFIFERLPEFENRREHLKEVGLQLAQMLGVDAETHIVPFITGSNESAIELSKTLQKSGFYVLPIRYPTVPKGKARLRFSLSADISIDELKEIKSIIVD
jgi:8-amino-7-oxononanoate synthase